MQQTIKTTNQGLVEILQGLYNVQHLKGLKFALVISKNIKALKEELNDLEDIARPTPEFMELAQQVKDLEAKKDKKGIEKLEKDNQKVVDERKKQIAELQEIMKEEREISLYPIKEELLPDSMNAKELTGIETLIK
jgi:flagellar motor component MotA